MPLLDQFCRLRAALSLCDTSSCSNLSLLEELLKKKGERIRENRGSTNKRQLCSIYVSQSNKLLMLCAGKIIEREERECHHLQELALSLTMVRIASEFCKVRESLRAVGQLDHTAN